MALPQFVQRVTHFNNWVVGHAHIAVFGFCRHDRHRRTVLSSAAENHLCKRRLYSPGLLAEPALLAGA